MSTLSQLRICVEKILPINQNQYNELKNNSNSPQNYQKLRAAFITKKLWPQGTNIKIAFTELGNDVPRTPLTTIKSSRDENNNPILMDPLQETIDKLTTHEVVRKVVEERIQPIISLNLSFTDKIEQAQIRISFDSNGGAWSLLGTDCLQNKTGPTMNFGWLDVATVIHEFGHALGMIHEHQNPQSNPIKWDEQKVLSWAAATQGWNKEITERNILDRYSFDQINGSVFDPLSIMLYFFPGSLTLNNTGTHQNLRLSGLDVQFLNQMYPNSKETASQFYESVYGETLNQSIEASLHHENKEEPIDKIYVLKWIMFFVLIIICITFLWKNELFPFKKTNRKYKHI